MPLPPISLATSQEVANETGGISSQGPTINFGTAPDKGAVPWGLLGLVALAVGVLVWLVTKPKKEED